MSWLKKIKSGLSRTSNQLTASIASVFTEKKLDNETLEQLQDILIMSDMGVKVAEEIIHNLGQDKFNKNVSIAEVKSYLSQQIYNILAYANKKLEYKSKPQVLLVCGVNGSGKTTTIGKIAHQLKGEGKTVLIAACDTFRAAADLQLKIWAQRAQCELVQGEVGADAASVAYRALAKAKAEDIDVLLIDTAGRLQNKKNLMDELAKLIKVMKKLDVEVPHEVLLVLDACTGQNALSQVEVFKEMVNISGLIITKLDGTAKAGILIAIAKKYALPIYLIGVGEGIEDLNEFNAEMFSKSLLDLN